MGKNYALYSIYLNIISIIIGVICLIFSILEHKFLIVTIVLISMTLIELIINIIIVYVFSNHITCSHYAGNICYTMSTNI